MENNKKKAVVIKFATLGIGGIESVIASQVTLLKKAGYQITLVLDKDIIEHTLPKEVEVKILSGDADQSLDKWASILKDSGAQAYIDHSILYYQGWVRYANAARDLGVKSIGWVHSAFVRPILEFSSQNVFLDKNINTLDQLIVLSDDDANYYTLLGHANVSCLPNPLPPVLANLKTHSYKEYNGTECLELVWVGRAQQSTKKIFDLIPFMKELAKRVPNTHLSIVGPFTWGVDEHEYREKVREAGLEENISIEGPKSQTEITEYYEKADIAISTSAIEGFPMTLVEANSFGLPVVMYALPWLWIAKQNNGIKSVPQDDFVAMADAVADIAGHKKLYESMSKAAIKKTDELRGIDFIHLYDTLINGVLPVKYSALPEVSSAGDILRLVNEFYSNTRDGKQAEIDLLRNENAEKQNQISIMQAELNSHLSIMRSVRLLAGNVKRKLRVRTRLKDLKISKKVRGLYKRHKKIRVGVLVGEFFANDMPYCNGKGGYGMIARNYLAEYIPDKKIAIDTICGFSDDDDALVHVVDGKKRVLFLPKNTPENSKKIRSIVNKYDIFLSIEFQDIANVVMQNTTRKQKLIYYIQDPRPEEDWIELDSVKRFRAIGYRPSPHTRSLMNSLYSSGRLIAISQGRDFIEKARILYALPESFSAEFVPNAVDLPSLSLSEIKAKKNTIVSLARLDIVKRPWIIGEVAKRLPEYNFVFAGQIHDKEMNAVMEPYLTLPNVHYAGHVEQQEKDRLLRDSKILINTSIHECIPVSFLEALSYGMLIVSNRNPDQITEKFGRAVKQVNGDGYEEVEALAAGIKQLIENDDLRVATAKKAVNYIKKTHDLERYTTSVRSAIVGAYTSE